MAGDWIKMRTDMYRDPKVCMIADLLLNNDGQLARHVSQNLQCDMAVTRNVTRSATVGALVSVWGVTRHRGKRVGDDLVVKNADVGVVDDIADLPGFGDAMAAVGWLVVAECDLVFPRFFEEFNTDPSEDARAKATLRQQRYRAKKRDVTVTSQSDAREEKRREEKNKKRNPISLFAAPTTEDVRAYAAEAKLSLDPNAFCDFYAAKNWMVGRNKMKDWKAAARNANRQGWCVAGGNGKADGAPYDEYQKERQRRIRKTRDLLDKCTEDATDGQV